MMECGELFVITSGADLMLQLPVNNWAIPAQVSCGMIMFCHTGNL